MVEAAVCLNARQVFRVIQTDGKEELSRLTSALFWSGIAAGLLVAAMVWMLASRDREPFLVILVFTWMIDAGDFSHIDAGTVEMAYLMLDGQLADGPVFFGFSLPVLAGNIVDVTVVSAQMVCGRARQELKD